MPSSKDNEKASEKGKVGSEKEKASKDTAPKESTGGKEKAPKEKQAKEMSAREKSHGEREKAAKEQAEKAERARAEKAKAEREKRGSEAGSNKQGRERSKQSDAGAQKGSGKRSVESAHAANSKQSERKSSTRPEKQSATQGSQSQLSKESNKRLAEKQKQLERIAEKATKTGVSESDLRGASDSHQAIKVDSTTNGKTTHTHVEYDDPKTGDKIVIDRYDNKATGESRVFGQSYDGRTGQKESWTRDTNSKGRESFHSEFPVQSGSYNPDQKSITIDNSYTPPEQKRRSEKSVKSAPHPPHSPKPEPPRPEKPSVPRPEKNRPDKRTIDFVKHHEGRGLPGKPFEKYKDSAGLQTIGYGHLIKPGEDFGNKITETVAEDLLANDLQTAVDAVNKLVKVPLTPGQKTALVSFTYNVGKGKLANSTMLKLLNKRNYQGAANEFSRWDKVRDAKTNKMRSEPGLGKRRAQEREQFDKRPTVD